MGEKNTETINIVNATAFTVIFANTFIQKDPLAET